MFKTSLKLFLAVTLTLGLSMSFQSLLASWTAPTVTPPGANVDEPINRGIDYQDKLGSLGIGSNLGVGGRQTLGGSTTAVPGIKSYLEFDSGNDFSLAKTDSSRIYRDTTGDFTGNAFNDFLVFEKTDGNNLAPDGGILFVNRNTNNYRELAVAIRGNGRVGIGEINPAEKLHVNGNIIASEPTDTNHVATKGYVDDAVVSGGGSLVCTTKEKLTSSSDPWFFYTTVYCDPGTVMTGGGIRPGMWDGYRVSFSYPSGNGFTCYGARDTNAHLGRCYVRCCSI